MDEQGWREAERRWEAGPPDNEEEPNIILDIRGSVYSIDVLPDGVAYIKTVRFANVEEALDFYRDYLCMV